MTSVAAVGQSVVFNTLGNLDYPTGRTPYYVSLARNPDGSYYGTALTGGDNFNVLCYSDGCGTVFVVNPLGGVSKLYSFCAEPDCADGANPFAGLVRGSDGNFYGTTSSGGSQSRGTIFTITPSGTLTTLHSFCSQASCGDGYSSFAPLLQARDGNYYGTTSAGGANGVGTVFKITPAGSLTTLYTFCSLANCMDGSTPYGGLVQDSEGNFYGTTLKGGQNSGSCAPDGCGTVFRMSSSGEVTTLHRFNFADGVYPYAGLVQARDGDFYGTTTGGGLFSQGTVFRITGAGTLSTLHSFCAQRINDVCTDGNNPRGPLLQGDAGMLYGTTFAGGPSAFGTVFSITPAGTLVTLHGFAFADGSGPLGGLAQAPNGWLYGTTFAGGEHFGGTVFSLLLVRQCAACPQ